MKQIISNYNPLFRGNYQHDSGEVMGTIVRMINDYTNEGRKEGPLPKINNDLRRNHRDSL